MIELYSPLMAINISLDFGMTRYAVGRLAAKDRRLYFEYDADFLKRGLNISPLRLPLKAGVQQFDPGLFDGLPGVFNDSLPDGWGRLLLDRALRSRGIAPDAFAPLDRLAHVGRYGMGALVYEPDYSDIPEQTVISLDNLAEQSQRVLAGESSEVLQELLALNGSSAGARPKAMIGVNADKSKILQGVNNLPENYEPWLVKFTNSQDNQDAGAVEYVYNRMAKLAGLGVMECHLFPAAKGAGYFATKRFDHLSGNRRLHKHTASGLLHTDFRVPSLDYRDLIKATSIVTRDMREAQKMFRLAVFNVLAHNRDDHAKNFSFLMDDSGRWRLAPAYDLTFSSGPNGEQSTMVAGAGRNPGSEDLLKLAPLADLSVTEARDILNQTCEALHQWEILAKEANVSGDTIRQVREKLDRVA